MALLAIFQLLLLFSRTPNVYSNEFAKEDMEIKEAVTQEQIPDPDDLKRGELRLVAPVLTDEEEGSRHMPHGHRCSGCTAVAYQFQKEFSMAEKKIKKGSRLPYSDVLEVTEDVCERKLSGYGLKSVRGEKFLSGEGLKHEKQTGVMEVGGKWEVRLKTLCQELIELYEEEGIYDQYIQRGDKRLDVSLCSGHCSPEEIEGLVDTKVEL